jgi:hypothetical protein
MSVEFSTRLALSPRKRVELAQVKHVYFELYPELRNDPERSALLLKALQDLAGSEVLTLPSRASWERIGNPALPLWVTLVRTRQVKEASDFHKVPWVPELGFWTELKDAQLESARLINEFLLARRGTLTLVPIKERSLQIFGDEKRLDSMRTGESIFSGRLGLVTLGAFVVPPPLPYRIAPAPGKPILIVENHNSYWSFGEWNQRALRYSAVVYGAGEAFRSTGAALGVVLHEVAGIGAEYLGDLDPKGVRIPLDFNRLASSKDPKVAPALEWYSWLLDNGTVRSRPECSSAESQPALDWLGTELGARLATLWKEGVWLPQEGLGFEQLGESI